MRSLKFFAFFLFCNDLTAANTDSLPPHQEISQGVQSYLHSFYNNQQQVTIAVDTLDSRIPIPTCSAPLSYQIPGNGVPSYLSTVKVSCPNSNWYIFVKAKVHQTITAVVAVTPLQKGKTITINDLATIEMRSSQLRGEFFSDPTTLVGTKVKRFVRANARITTADICVVCKGDQVTLVAVKGGLRVSAVGTALSDGMIGEVVRIKNNRSDRIVSARVKAVGSAELSL